MPLLVFALPYAARASGLMLLVHEALKGLALEKCFCSLRELVEQHQQGPAGYATDKPLPQQQTAAKDQRARHRLRVHSINAPRIPMLSSCA